MARSAGGQKIVLRNRKARHEFEVLEELEAGLVLEGAEVKSLRAGRASFNDSYAAVEEGELWLHNLHISPYDSAHIDLPDPLRRRKLLVHRRELHRLAVKTAERGFTLVPLDLHFTRGRAKVTLGLARGKKLHDKRESLKRDVMQREVERAIHGGRDGE
ncbi:MAG: SsrA-binding protein SmpB [Candidatus Palauibacterales bacterium]|nr:SsrA-binding protein SmpB [Candidatus Palauibacterales bacterium]MDP2482930.1 SsrA-binding protein SmpB [Candidatus Palauibacterales bacterium]